MDAYNMLLEMLKDYAQLETSGVKYIPLVIDVQKDYYKF